MQLFSSLFRGYRQGSKDSKEILLKFLFVLLMFISCGKQQVANKTGSTNASLIPNISESLYKGLSGNEVSLTFYRVSDNSMLIGGSIQEKSGPGKNVFCRKTAPSVPNAVSNYECWEKIQPATPSLEYQNLSSEEYYIDSGIIGSGTREKSSSNSEIICQRIIGVYPGATPNFSCYKKI